MVVVMMVMVVTVRSRPDPDMNVRAMMVMMMVMPDHNLRGPGAAALCQPFIVGFQQRQRVRDRIEQVAIAGSLREFPPACRRRLSGGHRGEGCGRSQQAG
jgi:hypothetical protein